MLIEDILATQGYFIYVILFLALMGGALGLPIPEDLPLIAAGIFAERKAANPWGLFLVCYSGVVVGDLLIFSMGRGFGATLFSKPWFKRRLSPRKLKRFKISLERRSLFTIFIARHLFYLRMVTFLACGAVKMRYSRFILADALAALVSVPIMMSIGYFAADYHEELVENLEWVFAILGTILLIVLLRMFRSKKTTRSSSKNDVTESQGELDGPPRSEDNKLKNPEPQDSLHH